MAANSCYENLLELERELWRKLLPRTTKDTQLTAPVRVHHSA